MLKKLLASLMLLTCTLQANDSKIDNDSGHSLIEKARHCLQYGVFSNQVAIDSGSNILWSPATLDSSSDCISVDNAGFITLPARRGVYLVQYTVKVSESEFAGTSSATVQLQQTNLGISTNILQPAVTSTSRIDLVTSSPPESQTQITGYAVIRVTGALDNVINLTATFTGSYFMLATTGTDANAQIMIQQIR